MYTFDFEYANTYLSSMEIPAFLACEVAAEGSMKYSATHTTYYDARNRSTEFLNLFAVT